MSLRRISRDVLELWADMDEADGVDHGKASRELARRDLARANQAERRYQARRESRRVAALRWDAVGAFNNVSAADRRVLLAQLLTELPTLTGSMRRMAQLLLQEYGNVDTLPECGCCSDGGCAQA